MQLGDDDEEGPTKCSKCLSVCANFTTFLLSHIGLISLVVGYCIVGAFTFEALERQHEIQVKKNMTMVRQDVAKYLWTMTKSTHVILPEKWLHNATLRLQEFEKDLLRAMKKDGWDGSEDTETMQWTFSGALFYSIITVTTIGYGHIAPKTVGGKVVTIFYAIVGIPLMLLCLSHIGNFMAKAFRFLYYKVCCYMCTRSRRPKGPRNLRGSTRRGKMNRSSQRGMALRSVRSSQRSQEAQSDENRPLRHSLRKAKSQDNLRPVTYPGTLRSGALERSQKVSSQLIYSRSSDFSDVRRLQRLPVIVNKYAEDGNEDFSFTATSRPQMPRNDPIVAEPYYDIDVAVNDDFSYEYDYTAYGSDEDIVHRPVPIWLCVLLVLGYVIFGAFLFSEWEEWDFLDSAYFCFISLSTIGFGDLIPDRRVRQDSAEMSIALCSIYLLLGISLLAMSFNLVQEQVIQSVKKVGLSLGIIREEVE